MCKKELMLCDREKAIRRCQDKQYRMERQLQQMERRLDILSCLIYKGIHHHTYQNELPSGKYRNA